MLVKNFNPFVKNIAREILAKNSLSFVLSLFQQAADGSIEVNDGAFYDSDSAPEPPSAVVESVSEASNMPDLTSAVDVVAAMQEAWDAAAETEEIEEPEITEQAPQYKSSEAQEVVVNGEVPVPVPGQRCVALFSYEVSLLYLLKILCLSVVNRSVIW